ncbi:hypothetical protein MKX01_008152 [Papaver californicum]|nr:hypothetical protein MKX01_008152 [Papaver californicum]
MHSRILGMEGTNTDPPSIDWKNNTGVGVIVSETVLEESMWKLGLGGGGSRNTTSGSSYPERLCEPNCVYYMRTGSCGYGIRCRFNHPCDRTLALGAERQGEGDYPEREGEPFNHPKFEGGPSNAVLLNYYGYPLRPGDKECSYYIKTGQYKFGETCKFHHPQPSSPTAPAPAPEFYQAVHWQVGRPSLMPSSFVKGTYGSVLVSGGMVRISGWSPYPGSPTFGAGSPCGVTRLSPSAPAYTGAPQPFSIPIQDYMEFFDFSFDQIIPLSSEMVFVKF